MERNRRQRRQARQRWAIARIADHVSHDFRSSLSVINEYVSLFQDGLCGDVTEEQRQTLAILEDRGNELNSLVDGLCDLRGLHDGRLKANRKNCLVPELIQSLLRALEQKASFTGLEIDTDIDADLPEVFCDPRLIGRALLNLSLLAIKSCGRSGRVSLRAFKDSSQREVSLEIRAESSVEIEVLSFLELSRGSNPPENPRKERKEFRLGFTVARKLIDLNLGTLIELPAKEQGSTFVFGIPLAEPAEALWRFLRRRTRSDRPGMISGVRIKIQGDASRDADALALLESLFHDALRRDALLFRQERDEWLVILPHAATGLSAYESRLHALREEVNRNWLRGPLPEIELTVQKTWALSPWTRELLEEIVNTLTPPRMYRHETICCPRPEEKCTGPVSPGGPPFSARC